VGDVAELAIFPLSNVVLFPRVQTPLHLFEPRYRQMAEHVLAGTRRIGMVAVPPEHVAGMPGDPPVYPIGCEGVIAQAQRLADGRYDIVLVGSRRFRIRSEPPRTGGRLYRVAEVEALADPYPSSERPRVEELRRRITAAIRALAQRADPRRAELLLDGPFGDLDDATFVDSLSNALAFDPPEKQGLLEAASIPERFERLEGLLAFRLAATRGTPADPRVLH
jgi:Lon protease-like protein